MILFNNIYLSLFFCIQKYGHLEFPSNRCLTSGYKLLQWQLLSIIQHLTCQLNITILTDFQIFLLPVGPPVLRLMRCNIGFKLPSWLDKQSEWFLYRVGRGDKIENPNVSWSNSSLTHLLSKAIKTLFLRFCTSVKHKIYSSIKGPKASLVHIENATIRKGLNFSSSDILETLR